MRHGDISNHVNVSFGIMCEDTLIHFKDTTLKDKILNKIVGKTKRLEIDETVRSSMEYIYRNTEYTVDLLVKDTNLFNLRKVLDDLPYNRIVVYSKLSQITSRLLTGDLSYVVDNNDERRSQLNSIYAITLNDLSCMIKRGTQR